MYERKFVRSESVTPSCDLVTAYLCKTKGHRLAWWFDWGGTPLKRYQGRPKVCSGESEIHRSVQKQKQA